MDSSEENSPFRGFTPDEIAHAEASAFNIHLGGDFFIYKGRYSFTKDMAELLYEDLRKELNDKLADDHRKDHAEVLTQLLSLRIVPLRFN